MLVQTIRLPIGSLRQLLRVFAVKFPEGYVHMSQVFYQSRGIIGHASNTSPCDFEDALGHYTFYG